MRTKHVYLAYRISDTAFFRQTHDFGFFVIIFKTKNSGRTFAKVENDLQMCECTVQIYLLVVLVVYSVLQSPGITQYIFFLDIRGGISCIALPY